MESNNNTSDSSQSNNSEVLKKFEEANKERVQIIKKEFEEGFKFLGNNPLSVSVFGSSRFKENNVFYEHARKLGGKIASELKYSVSTGGGPGIMEAANRGAFEAGGTSLGLTIHLPREQHTNEYLTDKIEFYYFFSRKVCLSFSAEAYVFYPGGFGTLDEFFEIITLVQTQKISSVPIILVGKKYWKKFDKIIKKHLSEKFQTISPEDSKLYTITDDFDQIIEIIKKAPQRDGLNNHRSGLEV